MLPLKTSRSLRWEPRFPLFTYLISRSQKISNFVSLPVPPRWRPAATRGDRARWPNWELHSAIVDRLSILPERILCEYGMCELSSQAYDGKLGQANPAPRLFRFPPWARARVVSPETLDEVAPGQAGLLEITDLANVGSALCVLTEDLAKRHEDGFELLGRAEPTESRGCSLMNLNHA